MDYLRQLYINAEPSLSTGEMEILTSAANAVTLDVNIVTTFVNGGQYSTDQLNALQDMATAREFISTDIRSLASNATVTRHWSQFKIAYEAFSTAS
jgi:hypothetical protein